MSMYHRELFDWHCVNFFDFREALGIRDLRYLKRCFRLPKSYQEVTESGYEHFSFYTYSHRVLGHKVNSSRIAYGSVTYHEEAWMLAKPVLRNRAIKLPDGLVEGNCFYGLGWDVEAEQFKVYFRSVDWRTLPPAFEDLVEGYDYAEHLTDALLSLTFEGTEIVERKVYLYPKGVDDSPAGISGLARMITDRRGEVRQDNVEPNTEIPYELNALGQKIVALYKEAYEQEDLDTIAYKNKDDFTLYFP